MWKKNVILLQQKKKNQNSAPQCKENLISIVGEINDVDHLKWSEGGLLAIPCKKFLGCYLISLSSDKNNNTLMNEEIFRVKSPIYPK